MKCGTTVSVYYSLHLQNAACPSEVLFTVFRLQAVPFLP